MRRTWWMGLAFAVGATCFLIGPFPGYADLVGGRADAMTFFVGSIFFTTGGLLQCSLAFADRRVQGPERAAWWAAIVQSVGTLAFNVSTFEALDTAFSNPQYDQVVWRPDAYGSVCFLVSGLIAYRAAPRRTWRLVRDVEGWWQPGVNLLGCVLFGVSAVAGYVVPTTGAALALTLANVTTSLGAACFLTCAIAAVRSGRDDTPTPDPVTGTTAVGRLSA